MASVYLTKLAKTFPVGTSVGIYLRSQRVNGAPPQGSAVTSATVAAPGTLSVAGLQAGTKYSAYAQVSSVDRYVDITTEAQSTRNEFWIPSGGVVETIPLRRAISNLSALATGTLYLAGGVTLPKGRTISQVGMMSATTALSGGTHSWAVIADQNRKVKAVSADDTTATLAANTKKLFTMATPYTPPDDTPVYLGVMFAGTVPTLQGSALNHANVSAEVPILCGTSNTSQTTPPAVGDTLTAITATANLAWLWAA